MKQIAELAEVDLTLARVCIRHLIRVIHYLFCKMSDGLQPDYISCGCFTTSSREMSTNCEQIIFYHHPDRRLPVWPLVRDATGQAELSRTSRSLGQTTADQLLVPSARQRPILPLSTPSPQAALSAVSSLRPCAPLSPPARSPL